MQDFPNGALTLLRGGGSVWLFMLPVPKSWWALNGFAEMPL